VKSTSNAVKVQIDQSMSSLRPQPRIGKRSRQADQKMINKINKFLSLSFSFSLQVVAGFFHMQRLGITTVS
jgi:hypothetical protein